ncbi:hypothetical protein F7725_008464 [Dissostichus mawsoni]|uniref:Uncharacterized protein n=1 Tax=Dissostichus mawsoni TaxID=36200 RepID=A0A7J5Y8J6_DISMA|nr:hypothetical protein F7725_008464 [Dissostichus mawsoni]
MAWNNSSHPECGAGRCGRGRSRRPALRHGALLRVAPRPVPTATGHPPRIRVLDVPSARETNLCQVLTTKFLMFPMLMGPPRMCPSWVGGGEGGHVDGVSDGLVAGRVDHVPQSLLGVLDAAALRVASVEHDDLVLVGPLVQDVSERQQRGRVGEDGAPPGRVALVSDHQVLLVRRDRLEQNRRLLFEGHADPRHHHLPEQLHVREDPLVSHRGDPEVSFEQGVEPMIESPGHVMSSRPQSSPPQHTEAEAEHHQSRVDPAEAVPGDACQPVVVVLVDVGLKFLSPHPRSPSRIVSLASHSSSLDEAITYTYLVTRNLPGQPALAEGGVEGEEVREVTRLAAAAALVLLHPLSDGLHLPLLAVRSCGGNINTFRYTALYWIHKKSQFKMDLEMGD